MSSIVYDVVSAAAVATQPYVEKTKQVLSVLAEVVQIVFEKQVAPVVSAAQESAVGLVVERVQEFSLAEDDSNS